MTVITNIEKLQTIPFFFVMGRSRSGTTLVRTLFDAHPNVKIGIENPFIIELHKIYGQKKKWSQRDLLNFYNDLQRQEFVSYYSFSEMNFDHQKLKDDLLGVEGICDFQTLIKIVYSNFKSNYPKADINILGDKNPSYSLQIEKIFDIFPDSKFIYLTRDYRDHILSVQKAGFGKKGQSIEQIAYKWRLASKKARAMFRKYPASFLHVRYEDFVGNPPLYFRKMCDFLKIDYHSEVFDFYKKKEEANFFSKDLMDKYQQSLFNPIDASKVENWKKIMNVNDVQLADLVVGRFAEHMGYERRFAVRKPLKLLFTIYPYMLGKEKKQKIRKKFIQRLPRFLRSRIKL